MKVYFSFTKGYALGLCFFALVAFSTFAIVSNGNICLKLGNELSRENYLKSKGYSVSESFSVKNIVIDGESFTEYTYITEDRKIIRLNFDGEKLVGEQYDRYKT